VFDLIEALDVVLELVVGLQYAGMMIFRHMSGKMIGGLSYGVNLRTMSIDGQ
jgi:hypothetical protein